MLLQKTDKARLELTRGVRTLGLRERALLLLVEQQTYEDLLSMYGGEGAQIIRQLVAGGYLAAVAAPDGRKLQTELVEKNTSEGSEPSAAVKSLAGLRMFLFDICERMFSRRDPALALQFREALRNARERESMLAVGETILEEIERLAGRERAAAVRERVVQLLP